jgi:NADH:ubiquinone oxidoreductase subunit H
VVVLLFVTWSSVCTCRACSPPDIVDSLATKTIYQGRGPHRAVVPIFSSSSFFFLFVSFLAQCPRLPFDAPCEAQIRSDPTDASSDALPF